MNKKFVCAIIAIATVFVAVAMTRQIIVINNNPVAVSQIDSISFDVSTTPPIQKVWHGGVYTASTLADGASSPLLTDMPLDAGIYRIENPSDDWDLMYVTPIGFFFRSSLANIVGEEIDDDNKVWYYESFDALKTAQMQVFGIGWTKTMDYGKGETDYSYNDSITIISHETEAFQRESLRIGCYNKPGDGIAGDELRLSLYLHTTAYDQYDYESREVDLQQLIADFASLLDMPVVPKDADTALRSIAKTAEDKIKKLHDRNFAIVPRTGTVYDHDIYDCSVKHVYGRIYTPSSNFLKEAEYGILLDKNPSNLTVEKAESKVKLTQQTVMSDFNAYFSNLQRDTEYYYRTYCIIPKDRLDTYHFRYGDKNATTGYGRTKSFKTKTALLIDAEIKNDGRSIFNGRQSLTLPIRVTDIIYKWNTDEHKDEFDYYMRISEIPEGFIYNSYTDGYIQEGTTPHDFLDISLESESSGNSYWGHSFKVSGKQITIDVSMFYSYEKYGEAMYKGSVLTHPKDEEMHNLVAVFTFSDIMNEKRQSAQTCEVAYNYLLSQGIADGFSCHCHKTSDVSSCTATLADFYAFRDMGTSKSLLYTRDKDGVIEKNKYTLFYENTHNRYGDDLIFRESEQASVPNVENLHNTLKLTMTYKGEAQKAPSNNIAKTKSETLIAEGGIGSPMPEAPGLSDF